MYNFATDSGNEDRLHWQNKVTRELLKLLNILPFTTVWPCRVLAPVRWSCSSSLLDLLLILSKPVSLSYRSPWNDLYIVSTWVYVQLEIPKWQSGRSFIKIISKTNGLHYFRSNKPDIVMRDCKMQTIPIKTNNY